ncbi:hypothetical protein HPP92_010756 [Vanilla planifolia]|uniref:Uncharacterized protein n=1 Tax=Vanilla planifolia TaxID=51239 RepID=A0A835RA35_VANPL|nr:hypothetical protein HPP92_010756 [Vanilla planifolia]
MERRRKGLECYWKRVVLKAPSPGGLRETWSGRLGWRLRRRRTRQAVLGGRRLVLRWTKARIKRALKKFFFAVFRAWIGDYSTSNPEELRRHAELFRPLSTTISLAASSFLVQ